MDEETINLKTSQLINFKHKRELCSASMWVDVMFNQIDEYYSNFHALASGFYVEDSLDNLPLGNRNLDNDIGENNE